MKKEKKCFDNEYCSTIMQVKGSQFNQWIHPNPIRSSIIKWSIYQVLVRGTEIVQDMIGENADNLDTWVCECVWYRRQEGEQKIMQIGVVF